MISEQGLLTKLQILLCYHNLFAKKIYRNINFKDDIVQLFGTDLDRNGALEETPRSLTDSCR
jgi:hypothetical protein